MENTGEEVAHPESISEIELDRPHDVGTGEKPLEDISQNPMLQEKAQDDQVETFVPFPKGVSDDEDAEAFDYSLANRHSPKSPSHSKKSPMRPKDNSDHEGSQKTKRPRHSLFGRPSEENTEGEHDERPVEHDEQEPIDPLLVKETDDLNGINVSEQNIGSHMSNLNLEGQERNRSPSQRPYDFGFGFDLYDRYSTSPRVSPAPSEKSVVIPPDTQPVYELRTNIDRKKAFTWIDTDNSGNFDPAEELRQRIQKMNKAKAAKAAQRKKGKSKAHSPEENVLKCIVKLRFKAFGNVRNYTNDQDNWPDNWSEIDSDCERELNEYRAFFRQNTPDRERQHTIEDPKGEVDDLTGYPAARGCKTCRNHDHTCSITQGGAYPCDFCAEDDRCCELILPPKIRGGCKQCVEDGETCSFIEDPDQSACEHCAMFGHICEALPPEGYTVDRIVIDDLIYGEDRPFASCTVCRTENKRCSLKRKTDKPPCKYCAKNHMGCTFFEVPKSIPIFDKAAGKKRALRPTEGEAPEVAMPGSDYFTAEDLADLNAPSNDHVSREATPEIEMEDNLGHKGMLTKIKTCFSHPIRFGGLTKNVPDCNFCELPTFGFVGHFEKEVHVIQWHDGHGFTEVGGGHAQHQGITSMCQTCAIGRAQVWSCPGHSFTSLYPDDAGPEFMDALEELDNTTDDPQRLRHELQRWCSMCFTPALYACISFQPSLFATREDEDNIEGCGLRLCAVCEVRLREEFNGEISDMADVLDLKPKALEEDDDLEGGIVRADVGFFSRHGLLMKCLIQEAEEVNY